MNTRDMILETAFQGFLEEGFEKISLNELIKRTGLTKGAFYYHFKSKDELLSEIMHQYFHKYMDYNIEQIQSYEGTIEEKITIAISSITNIHARIKEISPNHVEPKAFLMLFEEGLRSNEQLREHNLQNQNKIMMTMRHLIEEGQKFGEIREDMRAKDLAYLLNATIKGSMFNWTIMQEELLEDLLKKNVSTFLKLILKTYK